MAGKIEYKYSKCDSDTETIETRFSVKAQEHEGHGRHEGLSLSY